MINKNDMDACRRAASTVIRLEDFKNWTRTHLKSILPYGALACVHGRIYDVGISLDDVFAVVCMRNKCSLAAVVLHCAIRGKDNRLNQLGLANATTFNNTGFTGTDNANGGLDRYQFSSGAQDYYRVNSFADFTLGSEAAWSGLGSGLTYGAPNVCVAPTTYSAIDYMDSATNWVSPLILDLDGDGVAGDLTHAYGERVYFDIDADGAAERVGWLNGDDALLAVDTNGNGRIDDITELFGDDRMPAFQKLAQWDSNQDGKVDAADAHYGQLKLWRDANRDGVSQASELTGLEIAGVHSISVVDTPYLQSWYVKGHGITSPYAQENYVKASGIDKAAGNDSAWRMVA